MWQRFLNSKKIWIWTAIMVLFAGIAIAAEQTGQMQQMYQEKAREMTQAAQEVPKEMAPKMHYLRSVSKMMGAEIKNKQQQTVGKVNHVILDDNQDTIYYVILSSQGALYPVPWSAFHHEEMACTFDITTERLSEAPTIETVDVKQLAEADFRQKVEEFYSKQISAAEEKTAVEQAKEWMKEKMQQLVKGEGKPTLYKCADIIGLKVENIKGEELGKVHDIIADVREGALAYGFVSFGGMMQMTSKTAAIPWTSLTILPDRQIATLDATTANLESAALDPENLARLSEPQFARMIHDTFGTEPYWEVFGFVPAEEMSTTPWLAQSVYNRRFDPTRITTVEGTLRNVSSFYPEKGAVPGLSLIVESKDGQLMTVHTGPRQYVTAQDIRFTTGSDITVIGSRVTIEDKPVIMATEIRSEGRWLRLRDANGQPLWKFEKMMEKPQSPMY